MFKCKVSSTWALAWMISAPDMETYAESNLYLRSKVSSVWALTFLTLPRLKFQK